MIGRIRIRNFKSFKDVEVDLGLTNVLVGPNMSGKSNFIDVFRFLLDLIVPAPNIQGLSNAMNKRNGFREIAWKGESSNMIALTLDGTVIGKEGKPLKWAYDLEMVGERRFGNVNVQREELTLFRALIYLTTHRVLAKISAWNRTLYRMQSSTSQTLTTAANTW
jgi:predicted ATPase